MHEGIHLVRVWDNCNRKQTEKQEKNSKHEEGNLKEKINVVGLENPALNKKTSLGGGGKK